MRVISSKFMELKWSAKKPILSKKDKKLGILTGFKKIYKAL